MRQPAYCTCLAPGFVRAVWGGKLVCLVCDGERKMSERLTRDVTMEYERMRAELMLIRVQLGLAPYHDVLSCVRKLHEDGREAFEQFRGPACDYAHNWAPR